MSMRQLCPGMRMLDFMNPINKKLLYSEVFYNGFKTYTNFIQHKHYFLVNYDDSNLCCNFNTINNK